MKISKHSVVVAAAFTGLLGGTMARINAGGVGGIGGVGGAGGTGGAGGGPPMREGRKGRASRGVARGAWKGSASRQANSRWAWRK